MAHHPLFHSSPTVQCVCYNINSSNYLLTGHAGSVKEVFINQNFKILIKIVFIYIINLSQLDQICLLKYFANQYFERKCNKLVTILQLPLDIHMCDHTLYAINYGSPL